MQDLTLPVAGLVTDPGPFTAAPKGSLLEAHNVNVVRPGVIEPRSGIISITDATLAAGGYEVQDVYADPDDGGWSWARNGSGAWIMRKNPTTITGPTSFSRGKIRVEPTGGRALFTSNNGVCTLPQQAASPQSGSSTVAYRAGLPWPAVPDMLTSSITPTWLANGSSVAYRVTLRRRLANGTLLESAPSNRVVLRNTSGSTQSVDIATARGWLTPDYLTKPFGDLIAGDEMAVYRGPKLASLTDEPSDEMMLRVVLAYDVTLRKFIDPANASGAFDFIDTLDDGQWSGPALYTNSTQEGAASANFRPEYSRDIALYKNTTFYAGATTSQRLDLRLQSINNSNSPRTSLITHVFGSTAGITGGSPTITGIAAADMRFLHVGMVIQASAANPMSNVVAPAAGFPANTYIVSLTSTTATMSANASATAASANLTAWDWVQVADGTSTIGRLYAKPDSTVLTGSLPGITFDQTLGAYNAETRWQEVGGTTQPVQLRITAASQLEDMIWSFFRADPTEAAFNVTSSKPLAWDVYVDHVTGVTSETQGGIAELRWSKVGEPEHCPIANRTTVGDAAYPIRRILAVQNALLIFKGDGLFQCYGQPGDLTFTLLDRTVLLPYPGDDGSGEGYDMPSRLAARYDDRVYIMSTRGPMVVTDAGAQIVGAPILETLREDIGPLYGAGTTAARAIVPDYAARRVVFFTDGNDGKHAYVLDVDAGVWTTWDFSHVIAAAAVRPDPADTSTAIGIPPAPWFMAGGARTSFMWPRTSGSISDYADTHLGATCTIASVTGSGPYTVTISAGSLWTPKAGDVLIRSGLYYTVTDVTSATVFTTDEAPTTGTASWAESYLSRVVWIGNAEANPAAEKHWYSFVITMELAQLMYRMRTYFGGYRNTAAPVEAFVSGDVAVPTDDSDWTIAPAYKRASVSPLFARDWALKAGFSIQQAGARFATAGCSLEYTPVATARAAR